MSRLRKAVGAAVAVAVLVALAAPGAEASPASASYTVSVGSTGTYSTPTDTSASPYIDKDGTFYFQQSASLYGASDPRYWQFYTGTNFDDATESSSISNAVNPANSSDSNADTTWRCNNSPTGLTASFAPSGSGYAQKNYCDLVGVWVDPDTGNWYGMVHNEFTPQPFGDGLHFDAIDYAVSTDQGKVWTIENHAITSPYSTTRNDTTAFPGETYDYGDGDPRLYTDTASGYFYLYYGSRIVDKTGSWAAFYEHVARAPISGKMAPGTWEKWYNGSWSQPGLGGQESNMVPVNSSSSTGYTPVSSEYNPANTGTAAQQIAAGQMPPTSPLFVMDITYDAYLGLYIGEPQNPDQSGNAPQQYYATDNLATQKWYLLGDTGSYTTASWYRWFLDSANKTSSNIVGKSFRSYCSFGCSGGSSGQYANVTIGSSAPATSPVSPNQTYSIGSGSGVVLSQVSGSSATTSLASAGGSSLAAWSFTSEGDGSYQITNAATGQALGVDSTSTANRAWGTAPTVTTIGSGGPTVGQEWFVIANTSPSTGAQTGTYRLVNRYSGLVLGMSSNAGRLTETTPNRDWTNTTGNSVGGTRSAAEQTLTFTQSGSTSGPETVNVTNPGTQTTTVGTAASLQIGASDSQSKALTYSATGLLAGLSINSAGLITGTPTATGSSTVTVTASSGTASGSASFTWTVNSAGSGNLNGAHTLTLSGEALDDPNWSTTAGTQLDSWTANGGANQSWTFTQQSDGSYTIKNASSDLCADDFSNGTTAGTIVDQWTCNGGANQNWKVAKLSSGAYTITNETSGLLLTTSSTSDGALITQQANTNSSLQQWTIN